nr:immunoglobulin heavy chain junction region [Macaca mulatta]MOW98298.1 immunoglobulin heavy chain junction region [Macaca mulatta]MOW98319.1 immunoglobulin heavy chain junction region [Macaca mulatta]MOW98384.1 immunoglobulin heavy chain junction region [Macaca mulatta]MOW98393.1 immunoglobulin heavy chain junction region [Macaca mulatta]
CVREGAYEDDYEVASGRFEVW